MQAVSLRELVRCMVEYHTPYHDFYLTTPAAKKGSWEASRVTVRSEEGLARFQIGGYLDGFGFLR